MTEEGLRTVGRHDQLAVAVRALADGPIEVAADVFAADLKIPLATGSVSRSGNAAHCVAIKVWLDVCPGTALYEATSVVGTVCITHEASGTGVAQDELRRTRE